MSDKPIIARVVEQRDRWKLLAVLSWIIPVLAGIGSMLLLVTQGNLYRYGVSWVMLAAMMLLGLVLSIAPLAFNTTKTWTASKTNAVVGIVFGVLSMGWFVLCLLVAVVITMEPARRQAIADARREEERVEAEFRQRQLESRRAQAADEEAQRLAEEEHRRAEEEQRYQQYVVQHPQRIAARDEDVIRRFQQGDDGGRLPEIPTYDNPHWIERESLPVPPVPPHPLTYAEHAVTVETVDRELGAGWMVVDDLKVRRLALPIDKSALAAPSRRFFQRPSPKLLSAGEESPLVYLIDGSDRLREIDTRSWRLIREVDLGGRAVDLTRCRDGIVVGVAKPGMILVLDPRTLQTKKAVPVPDLQQVVGSGANNRLFVRINLRGNFSLAMVNLDTDQVERIMRIDEATRLGNVASDYHERDTLGEIGLTDDGKILWAISRGLCRWSVDDDGRLDCLELGQQLIGDQRSRAVSANGRFLATRSSVIDMTGSVAENVFLLPSGRGNLQPIALAAEDGRMYCYSQDNDEFAELSSVGIFTAYHDWQSMRDEGQMQSVHLLPQADQWLIRTKQEWVVASRLPNAVDVPLAPNRTRPILEVVDDQLPAGEVSLQKAVRLPEIDGVTSVRYPSATQACFSSDGKNVYALAWERLSRIDAETGEVRTAVKIPRGIEFKYLLFNSAGVVLVGGAPKRYWILDPMSLEVIHCLVAPETQSGPVSAAEITTSPATPLVIVRSHGDYIMTINLHTAELVSEVHVNELKGEPLPTSTSDRRATFGLQMTPDGKRLLIAWPGQIFSCDVTPEGFAGPAKSPRVYGMSKLWISGDSQRAAVNSKSAGVFLFDIDQLEEPVARISVTSSDVAGALDRAGQVLWRAGLHRYGPGQTNRATIPIASDANSRLEFSPDGNRLLAVGSTGMYLVDLFKWKAPPAQALPSPVSDVALTDDDYDVAEQQKGYVLERKRIGDAQVAVLDYDGQLPDRVHAFFSPDGKWLYTLGEGNTVHQVDLETLTLRRTLTLNRSPRPDQLYWAAGHLGVDCTSNNIKQIWLVDPQTLQPKQHLKLPLNRENPYPFSIAADVPLAFRCQDGLLSIIDLAAMKTLQASDLVVSTHQTGLGFWKDPRFIRVSSDGSQVICGLLLLGWDENEIRPIASVKMPGISLSRDVRWQPDQKRMMAVSEHPYKKVDSGEERSYLPMYCADAPDEPVELLPFPVSFAQNPFDLRLSDDRLWIHSPPGSAKDRRLAMICLDGHAMRTAEFPRTIRWFKPAPRGPRALARADTGALYLVELQEARE